MKMPQEFQVLQCFSCKTFQVHQVKKAKKWSCKMCGEKQSVIKVYGRGTGAECRQHVQALNTHRGEIEQIKETLQYTEKMHNSVYLGNGSEEENCVDSQSGSKWGQFVEEDTSGLTNLAEDQEDDANFTTDASLLDRRKTSRKRKNELDEHLIHRAKSIRYEDVEEYAATPTDHFSYEYKQAQIGHVDLKDHGHCNIGHFNNPMNGHIGKIKNSRIKHRYDKPEYGRTKSVSGNRQQMHSQRNYFQENDENKDEQFMLNLRSDPNNFKRNMAGRLQSKNHQNSTWNTKSDEMKHNNVSNIHHVMPKKSEHHKTSNSLSDWRLYAVASGDTSSQESGGNIIDDDNACGENIIQVDNRQHAESSSSKWNMYTASGGGSSQECGGDNNDDDNVTGENIIQIDNRQHVESSSSKWNVYTASSQGSCGDEVEDTISDLNNTVIDTRPYVEFSKSDLDNKGLISFPLTSQKHTSGQEEKLSRNEGRASVPPRLYQLVNKRQTSSSKWDLFAGTSDSISGDTCSSLANNRPAWRSVDGDIPENLNNESDRLLQREVLSSRNNPHVARSLNVNPETSVSNDNFLESDPKLTLTNKAFENQDSNIKRKVKKDILPVQIHTNASSMFSVGDLTDDDLQL